MPTRLSTCLPSFQCTHSRTTEKPSCFTQNGNKIIVSPAVKLLCQLHSERKLGDVCFLHLTAGRGGNGSREVGGGSGTCREREGMRELKGALQGTVFQRRRTASRCLLPSPDSRKEWEQEQGSGREEGHTYRKRRGEKRQRERRGTLQGAANRRMAV